MAKVKPHSIDPKEKYEAVDNLFDVISKLKTKKEVVDFFLGLFTASESLMMARRIQVARMLLDGKSYETIMRKLHVSSQMIHKTDQWLHKGDNKHVAWLKSRLQIEQEDRKTKKLTYESMLDKYPYHRFLKNLFD
jgi:TrpR-related protein YerC/YecD